MIHDSYCIILEPIVFLKQLNLTNFRNYSKLNLSFDQRPTIFIGNNAAGKSNILESIYLLSTSKSIRVDTEGELVKKEENFSRVEGEVEEDDEVVNLAVLLTEAPPDSKYFKKKVLVNGVSRRVVDFVGNLPAVIFYPSDIEMITGSPSLRRWHLDLSLAQIDSSYKKALTLYEQYLTARNKVLKRIREGEGKQDELTFWTDELLKNAEIITKKREQFFEFINNLKTPLGNFRFEYDESEISIERLSQLNGREVAAAATLIGPHRDDFRIFLDERDMAHYGSRGEQRTATLAFKLAQLEYMTHILGKRPVLLLDDVFSELDAEHRAHVVEVVDKQQTIIATVELENIPQDFLNSARILRVEEGRVFRIRD